MCDVHFLLNPLCYNPFSRTIGPTDIPRHFLRTKFQKFQIFADVLSEVARSRCHEKCNTLRVSFLNLRPIKILRCYSNSLMVNAELHRVKSG